MRELLEKLGDPILWIPGIVTVAVVAPLLGIIKRRLDKLLALVSTRWRRGRERRLAKRQAQVHRLAENNEEWISAHLQVIISLLLSLMLLVMSLALMFAAVIAGKKPFGLFASGVTSGIFMVFIYVTLAKRGLVREAGELRKA